MEIRRGIVELLEAIPERIEVSGTGPTWRVTGGSFEAVLGYANEAFDEPVVLDREDRSRWWPRVTVTVTTDPELAAGAPPLEALVDPEPEPEPEPEMPPDPDDAPRHRAEERVFDSFLEEIFTHQEELRRARSAVPEQRRRRRANG
jgi:hypothetical protein